MTDVARRAGVSSATVSRALRGVEGVSVATRDRIRQIADELGYVVSPEASRLASGVTSRVAVVVPTISRWFYATMLAGIEGVLRDAEIDVLIYHVEGAADRDRFFERLPARRKVDAVVLIALPITGEQARRLDLMGVAIVAAGGKIASYPSVRIDDEIAARQAMSHLLEAGHRRIAFIMTADSEKQVWASDTLRRKGYVDALAEADIPVSPDLMVTVPWGIDGGAKAMDRLLSLPTAPTAVFAHSDEVAIGALRTLRRAAIAVPHDMSIVSVDDHPMAELNDLTTVHQSVELQGQLAGHLVLDLMSGKTPEELHLRVPTRLVVRGSVAAPPSVDPSHHRR